MKSSSPPPAPDPYATAAAQTTSNIDTAVANAIMNNATTVSPYGTQSTVETGQTYDTSGHLIPTFQTTLSLSPEQQRLYDQQTQLGIGANNIALGMLPSLQTALNTPAPTLSGDYTTGRNEAEAALNARLNPQLQQSRTALETQLVNQGLVRGTPAFDAAMDQQTRQENDAHLSVIAQAGQEQDREFSEDLQRAQYGMAAETLPINEVSALMGLGQVTVPQMSGFQGSQVAGTPVGQYVYQSAQQNLDAWKAQQQAQAQTMGGLFGLGGSLASFGASKISDRRLKRDIISLGVKTSRGFNLYSYRLHDRVEREVGVMADEVASIMPGAVILMPDDFLAVDYAQVM